MTAILRVALLTALVAFSIPAVAAAQKPPADSLLRRIDLLERRSADLEQRVRELESVIKGGPSRDVSVPTSTKWQDLQNWRRLRRGMTMDDVRALLAEPGRVEAMGVGTQWSWDYAAHVAFDRSGTLQAWSEPDR
jgi:hypothetical protein